MSPAPPSSLMPLAMELVQGSEVRSVFLNAFPFVLGRAAQCDLVLDQPYVSRLHAEIVREGPELAVQDTGSRHGTFVNGERVQRRVLLPQDVLQFGSIEGPRLKLSAPARENSTAHPLEAQLQSFRSGRSDLEKLRWFLEAAQELNSASKVERVLASLLDTTLSLASMERGFVFLRDPSGALKLALGVDAHGHLLEDGSTLSTSVLRQAAEGTDQYVLTDSLAAEGTLAASIVAHNIRTILCIPLRQFRESRHSGEPSAPARRPVFGVLYLDSHFQPQRVSDLDHELLRTIAREAAALVENAQLAVIEDQARQHKEELQIAAAIQQGLMAVQIPSFEYAEVQARSIACHEVGGDFFDIIAGNDNLPDKLGDTLTDTINIALVDVSGKGISAAILASTLQGMLFTQLGTGQDLASIAAAINRYLCTKNVGKYATMLLLRLHRDGSLEYINCGHIEPRLCAGDSVRRLPTSNLPVGLLKHAQYEAGALCLAPNDRLVLVSDGFTEAENSAGDFFGDERFDHAARCPEIHSALQHMSDFCQGHPPNDDVTIVQLRYLGAQPGAAEPPAAR